MRIAYVEDNPTNQALVERVARMTHHRIIPYSEGEIALEALQQEQFDLILMDVELAGKVNGLDVVRMLRGQGMSTPIIAVTAYAMMGDRERCLAAGCNDYLPKPIPIKDLLAMLERYEALAGDGKDASPAVLPVVEQPAPTPAPVVPPAPELTSPEPSAPVADTTQTPSPQVEHEPPATAVSVAEIVQPPAESASPQAAPSGAVDPAAQSNAPTQAVAPAAVVDALPEPAPAPGLTGPPSATQPDQG